MIELNVAFWIFVIINGIIGAMRGWAKELLVSFSVLVALFIINIFSSFGPIQNIFQAKGSSGFWVPASILILMVIAGYQTPAVMTRFAGGKFTRDRFADAFLGFFIGLLNGYLIYGSMWYFMEQAGYPFSSITAPDPTPFIVNYLPPSYLTGVPLYVAVGFSFLFVLLVFI